MMNEKEAIKIINNMPNCFPWEIEALDMAIKALETVSCIKEKCAYCPHCEHCDVDEETLAIKALEQQPILDTRQRERQLEMEYQHGYDKGWKEGRKALEQQPCKDYISIDDAIEVIAGADETDGNEPVFSGKQIIEMLKNLSSITLKAESEE